MKYLILFLFSTSVLAAPITASIRYNHCKTSSVVKVSSEHRDIPVLVFCSNGTVEWVK